MDELAAAAGKDPVAYRLALLDKSPRAKAVLALAAEKADWDQPLPAGTGRGVSLQSVFGTYMAQAADVEVSKNGAVRVRRVVRAVANRRQSRHGRGAGPERHHLRHHGRALRSDHAEGR